MSVMMMMTDAWWSGESAGMIGGIGGSGLGILGGLIGPLVGTLAPRGIGRKYLLGGILTVLVLCVLSLITGLYALLLAGQPWQVWYPLVLLGGLGTLATGVVLHLARRAYRQAEQRKLQASALRSV